MMTAKLFGDSSFVYDISKKGDFWSDPPEWLKEKIDLANVDSFAIDGQIYLLRNNSQIVKLVNGLKAEFEVSDIDPKLVAPTKIKTFINSNCCICL